MPDCAYNSATLNEIRVSAARSGSLSHTITCGACDKVIADAADGILAFLCDSDEQWKGWVRSIGWRHDSPGGLWEVAPQHQAKQPALSDRLEMLPAIVECPSCTAGNLLDPEQLVLRPNQFVARAYRLVRPKQ